MSVVGEELVRMMYLMYLYSNAFYLLGSVGPMLQS